MANKFFDEDAFFSEVISKIAGQPRNYTLPPNYLSYQEARPDVDVSVDITKEASELFSPLLGEAYPKSVKLEGIDAVMLNPQDQWKAWMKVIESNGKKAALISHLSKLASDVAETGNADLAELVQGLIQEIE